MKTYPIPVTYKVFGYTYVQAENKTDLMNKLTAKGPPDVSLPDQACYVDNTLEIEFELLNEDLT